VFVPALVSVGERLAMIFGSGGGTAGFFAALRMTARAALRMTAGL
jgi:hypothetical protein